MHRKLLIIVGVVVGMLLGSAPRLGAQPTIPLTRKHDLQAALAQLERERGNVEAVIDAVTGTPAYLHGNLVQNADRDPAAAARTFIERYGAAWGIGQTEQTLRLVAQTSDQLGYINLRFEQRWAGLPVFDTDLRVQIGPDGRLTTINGQLLPEVQPPTIKPQLTREQARQRVQALVGGVQQTEPQLGVARIAGVDYLVWEMWQIDQARPARWRVQLDALNGTLRSQVDVLAKARDRRTFTAQNLEITPGELVRSENQPPVADQVVNAAHDNAGVVYDYFRNTFGRDSIDGAGMPIISTVHYGVSFNNAFWDGSQMVYGDGDGVQFAPLAQGLDVVAHELTHGIIEYTADLNYSDQSGALNEAFADIFAALIDSANWDIGETIYTPAIPADALRYGADPTRSGDPGVWGEYLRTSLDSGGVHSNSGIFFRLAYEIGTTIGRAKTAAIFYRVLSQKLTRTSDFVVARNLTIATCDELIGTGGINEQDCADVRMAFIRSGIGQPVVSVQPNPLPQRSMLPLVVQGSGAPPRLPPLPPTICGAQLVENGGFESGLRGWVTDASPATVSDTYPRTGGSRSAQLNASYQLLRYVRLPTGARNVTIAFNVQRSDAADPTQPTLEVRVEAGDGSVIAVLTTLTGAQPQTWQTFTTSLDVSTRRDVRLVFKDRYGTHTIDDVSIVATCS